MNFVPNPFIKKYWIIENPDLRKSITLSPMISDGHIEIMFVEGYGARFLTAQKKSKLEPGIYVTGHMKAKTQLALLPQTKIHFIKLEHWASSILSGFSCAAFENSIIPLADLNPSLANKLGRFQPSEEMRHIFNGLLEDLDRKTKGSSDFQMIQFVCNNLVQSHIDFKAQKEHILADTKVSDRTLEKKFSQYVGLTPKQFSLTVKMRRIAETLLYDSQEISLANLAFDNGFFDQSHFCRSFKACFGKAPSKIKLSNFFIPNSKEDFRYYTI